MFLRERAAPSDEPGWTHDLKFDGYRVLADICDGRVLLQTRNGTDATVWFPEVVQSLAALGAGRHVLDGEVCVRDDVDAPTSTDCKIGPSAGDIEKATIR